MIRKFYICVLVILISGFLVCGCSGSRRTGSIASDPVSPGKVDQSDNPLNVYVSDYDYQGNPVAGYGALGVYSVHVDYKSLTGDLTPLRKSSLADVLESVDITNFLKLAPCSDCAKLMGIELDPDGNPILKIGIKHPFPYGDPLKPITGRNRADLHVFNVEGTVITDGTGAISFPGLNVSAASGGLMDPDGYSGYLDESLDAIFPTEANLHPYIMHFDDYSAGNFDPSNPTGFESVTDPPPSGNLVMAMGCDYDIKDYTFKASTDIEFVFAVGCTYAVSAASKIERFTPQYRVPQHNKKAASKVWMEITNNDLKEDDTLSSADLTIYVVDINHGVTVGTALNEMFADSSVGEVIVEVPGVTSGSVSFGNTPTGGTGHDPSDPLIFNGTITNDADASAGSYSGIIKVLDTYQSGQNTSPLLNGQDGIIRVSPVDNPLSGLFNIGEFATYATFSIDVVTGGGLFAVIESDPEPPDALTCQLIEFTGINSYDNHGYNIVEYQWDWDYTGVPTEFTPDRITSTPEVKHQYSTEGLHRTGLRVVNDAPSPETSEPAFLEHTLVRKLPSEYAVQEVNRISATDSSTEEIWMPSSNSIVVDDNDVVHVFVKSGSDLVHYSYDAGTVTSETLGTMTGYAHQSAQIDSNNTIHLIWCSSGSMYYIENSTGTWSTPVAIASGADFESDPYSYSLGVNGQNEVMAVWQELFTTNHYMKSVLKTATGWESPVIMRSTDTYTGSPGSELAVMVSCAGTPGENGQDFHAMWTEQYTYGYMNPCVRYSRYDRLTQTWMDAEWVALQLSHYQDWSDMAVTSDGAVVIGSSYYWDNSFVAYRDPSTQAWNIWNIMSTSNDEYTSTIGANDDGTICIAYWERNGYPDPDPFEVQYKIFHKDMSQADVDAIAPQELDPSTAYEYYYSDIFMKECSFYVGFMDRRDTAGAGAWDIYYARISP